jgi:hypothetical protein
VRRFGSHTLVSTASHAVAEHAPRPRWLIRADDHQPFAYARGHDFYRRSDHILWAHLTDDGFLLSARSGAPIAYRNGTYFYDTETHTPVFYERA